MTKLNPNLIPKFRPKAKDFFVQDDFRFTVLTECLIRVEQSKNKAFCDDATQIVWYRDFPSVRYTTRTDGDKVVITTERSEFVFSKKGKKFLKITLDGKDLEVRDRKNLKGTCRTVDMRAGKVKLDDGIISRGGVAYMRDQSLILTAEGDFLQRKENSDVYVFAYGRDYRGALNDFYRLCGRVPMLPRYVLGNWWSRYHAYTQQEYLDVMKKFSDYGVPMSVATLDMDWHWVDVNEKFNTNIKASNVLQGEGWTGYSWNTDLFPDHKSFLRELHERGLRVTLNVHPADGVRYFEDDYQEMAKAVGVDASKKEQVDFDLSNKAFINAYFDILHRNHENDGVDFWWIDWQQGNKSAIKNLDPLWALNHFHYCDNARDGKKGLILSRYAGIGSHRYPLGFSGDCITRWCSLKFQPYMTATASNVGYCWWSHDIGGNAFGTYDDELYLRWCQLGVFSPINRLHSGPNDLQAKEPWKRCTAVQRVVQDFLRLRHKLVPYTYTAMHNASNNGVALCEPLYYTYPDDENAYKVKNEFFFGTQLIVCPITSKMIKSINLAKTKVWLPEGRYTDIFTNKVYQGGGYVYMFRDIEAIPVLAKQGGIIPLDLDVKDGCENPQKIEVLIYRGDGEYSLYEDDSRSGYAYTDFRVKESDGKITFSVSSPRYGDGDFRITDGREYHLNFKDVLGGTRLVNGEKIDEKTDGKIVVKNGDTVEITDYDVLSNGNKLDNAKNTLSRYQQNTIIKTLQYAKMSKITDEKEFLSKVKRRFGRNIYLAVKESMI